MSALKVLILTCAAFTCCQHHWVTFYDMHRSLVVNLLSYKNYSVCIDSFSRINVGFYLLFFFFRFSIGHKSLLNDLTFSSMAAADGRQGDDANDENTSASNRRSDDDEQGQCFCNRIRSATSIMNSRAEKRVHRLTAGPARKGNSLSQNCKVHLFHQLALLNRN